jgi:hypothetical protein
VLLKNLLIENQDTKMCEGRPHALDAENVMQKWSQQALRDANCKFEQMRPMLGKDEVGGSNPPSSSNFFS